MPLAGGLALTTGLILPVVAAVVALAIWSPPPAAANPTPDSASAPALLGYGFSKRSLQLAGILAGAFGMLIVGLLDDKHELRPAAKFAGQIAVALLVAVAGVRVTLFVHNALFSYALTILWILTVINAFNFMDNMNGLCSGLGLIGSLYFAGIAASAGQYLVALIGFLTAGALLGFLPYNFPRAKAFLGDAGSHLVGYMLAVMAILPHFYTLKHPQPWAVFKPIAVLAVPLGDLLWVVILRWRMGKPIYIGDTNHLSHRLVRAGLSRTQAVILIWLMAAAIGLLGFVGGV